MKKVYCVAVGSLRAEEANERKNMKKTNVILLSIFGSLGMISSLALVAIFIQKPVEQASGAVVRASKYTTGATDPGYTEIIGREDIQIQYSPEELRDMGITEQELEQYNQTGKLPQRFMGGR